MAKSIDECTKTHGRVWSVELEGDTGTHVVVFRKPRAVEWRKYQSAISTAKLAEKGDVLVDAQEDLVKAVCVSHEPRELDDIAEDILSFWFEVATELGKVATRDADVRTKKHEPGTPRP